MNRKLVICLFACALAGILAAASALLAGWSLPTAVVLCSFTASSSLLPATLLAFAVYRRPDPDQST